MTLLRRTLALAVGLLLAPPDAAAQNAKTMTRFDSATEWADFGRVFNKELALAPDRSVTVAADGLRFDFAPTNNPGASGVQTESRLRGDFEIAVKYALDTFPETVTAGYAPRFGLYIQPESSDGPIALNRGVWPGFGQQVRLSKTVTVGKEERYGIHAANSSARLGRLALRRIGRDLIGLYADTPDGELVEIDRLAYTDRPVRVIRLSADPGKAMAALKFRLYDLQIRTGSEASNPPPAKVDRMIVVNKMPDATTTRAGTTPSADASSTDDTPEVEPPAAPVRGKWWLIGLGVAVIFAVGVVFGRKLLTRPRVRLLAGLVGLCCISPPTASAQSLGSSFDMEKDAAKIPRLFRLFNTAPNRNAELIPGGIVFEIGPGKAPGNVGYDLDAHIVGDFQIEVKYEILEAPEVVSEGYGLMLGMRAKISKEVGDGAMNRGIYVREGGSYHTGRAVPLGGGTRYAGRGFPTKSKHGRMGLRRVGDTLYYFAAETPDGAFVRLTDYPYPGDKAVSLVTLYADSGGSAALFRGRLYDFKLMTGSAVPAALPKPGAKGANIGALPTAQEIAAANNKPTTPAGTVGDGDPTVSEPGDDADPPAAPVRGKWWLIGIGVAVIFAVGVVFGRKLLTRTPPPPRPRKPA